MNTLAKVKASKAKLKRQRDNWKRKATEYESIIRRTYDWLPDDAFKAMGVLDEADFWKKESK